MEMTIDGHYKGSKEATTRGKRMPKKLAER
jgi:hypothetical protein